MLKATSVGFLASYFESSQPEVSLSAALQPDACFAESPQPHTEPHAERGVGLTLDCNFLPFCGSYSELGGEKNNPGGTKQGVKSRKTELKVGL